MSEFHSSADAPVPSIRPKGSRPRFWIRILLYLIIFASGIAVGGGGVLIVARNRILHAVHHPDEMPKLIAQRMRRALSLSDEQVQQVEDILRDRQMALQEIRRQYQPLVEAELDRVEDQVAEILDANQQAKWRDRFEELRRTWVPAPPTAEQ